MVLFNWCVTGQSSNQICSVRIFGADPTSGWPGTRIEPWAVTNQKSYWYKPADWLLHVFRFTYNFHLFCKLYDHTVTPSRLRLVSDESYFTITWAWLHKMLKPMHVTPDSWPEMTWKGELKLSRHDREPKFSLMIHDAMQCKVPEDTSKSRFFFYQLKADWLRPSTYCIRQRSADSKWLNSSHAMQGSSAVIQSKKFKFMSGIWTETVPGRVGALSQRPSTSDSAPFFNLAKLAALYKMLKSQAAV